MDAIRQQLISSLIDSLPTSSDTEQIFQSLIDLQQFSFTSNYLIKTFSKTTEIKIKTELILFYFRYMIQKKDQFQSIDSNQLFDQFKSLINETPFFQSIESYHNFSSVLTLIIQHIDKIPDSVLYSFIKDISNENSNLAFCSLSIKYPTYSSKCFMNMISNTNNKFPFLYSLFLFLQNNKLEEIDKETRDFFDDKKGINMLSECIQFCLNQTENKKEYQKLGYLLLGSSLHFLPSNDSLLFYLNLSSVILKYYEQLDKDIQILILQMLSQLPAVDGDGTFNKVMQITSIIPYLATNSSDFESDQSNLLIEFIDKRLSSENRKESLKVLIESLFCESYHRKAALLLACRYDLYEDFYEMIFPDQISDVMQIDSIYYAFVYLKRHEKFTKSNISPEMIKTFLLIALKFTKKEIESELQSILNFLINFDNETINLKSIAAIFYENLLSLLNSSTITAVVTIFRLYFVQHQNDFETIEMIDIDSYVQNIFPFLLAFSVTPIDSSEYLTYLFILAFLNWMFTGKFLLIDSLINSPLSLVFEVLIPKDCHPIIHDKSLKLFESVSNNQPIENLELANLDLLSATALVSASLHFSVNNPHSIYESIIQKDTLNDLFFKKLISSMAYLSPDDTIEYFHSLVIPSNETDGSLLTLSSFKKTVMSLLSSPLGFHSSKFKRETVLDTLYEILALQLSPSNLSKLFSIFSAFYQNDSISKSILRDLSKQHQKCELSDKLIQSIISTAFFVDVLPDFLSVVQVLTEEIIQKSFLTFYENGNPNNYSVFIKSVFVNSESTERCFEILAKMLLDVTDISKMLRFSLLICKYKTNNGEILTKLTIRFISNILSTDDQIRILCQHNLMNVFLPNDDSRPFVNLTNMTFNESVLSVMKFFDEIADSELFNKFIDQFLTEICVNTNIEVPIASLCVSICKHHLETQNFVQYLTIEGNSNQFLIKSLMTKSLSFVLENHLKDFYNWIQFDFKNQFVIDFMKYQLKSNNVVRKQLFENLLSLFLTRQNDLLSDKDFQSAKIQLFPIFSELNVDDFLYDLRLIWISSLIFANVSRSKRNISRAIFTDYQSMFNQSLKNIFGRLHSAFTDLEESDFRSFDSFAAKIAQSTYILDHQSIKQFIKMVKNLGIKRNTASDIIVTLVFVLSYLLKSFIKLNRFPSSTNFNQHLKKDDSNSSSTLISPIELHSSKYSHFITSLTESITYLLSFAKDDASCIITQKYSTLFTKSYLNNFSQSEQSVLLNIAIRSLLILNKDTQTNNLVFLSMILSICPSEAIIQEKKRLIETITRCFDLIELVGSELLLDSLLPIASAIHDVESFNNMSQLSIPRLLLFCVDKDEVIRRKSNQVLLALASTKETNTANDNLLLSIDEDCYQEIIHRFIDMLGVGVVSVFAKFFVDWSTKNGFNEYSLKLILKFVIAIRNADKEHPNSLVTKVFPALMPFVNDLKNPLRPMAIDILTILMK